MFNTHEPQSSVSEKISLYLLSQWENHSKFLARQIFSGTQQKIRYRSLCHCPSLRHTLTSPVTPSISISLLQSLLLLLTVYCGLALRWSGSKDHVMPCYSHLCLSGSELKRSLGRCNLYLPDLFTLNRYFTELN